MKVKRGQVFNLMDTNGRRNDVMNALQGYLRILDNLLNLKRMQWKRLPESTAQFEFYKQAIEMSPEVFKDHKPYDNLVEIMSLHPDLNEAVLKSDLKWIQKNYTRYSSIFALFDRGIEDRARHYTSNLVKLGLVDEDRNISQVGTVLLDKEGLHKDKLEGLLPLNHTNIIYLRQLLKLRVFSNDGLRYYAPFHMAILALLKKERISINEFCELVQGISPYDEIYNIEEYIENYQEGDVVENIDVLVPNEVDIEEKISRDIFQKYFKNGKSANVIDTYYQFYEALYDFNRTRSAVDLDTLLAVYEQEQSKINKAFGYGRNIFQIRRGERLSVAEFLEQQDGELFSEQLNMNLYRRFIQSKTYDQIREYSDTTIRIFKATGLIHFGNGYVELSCRDLTSKIFKHEVICDRVIGNLKQDMSRSNHRHDEDFFCNVHSLEEILEYTDECVDEIINEIQAEFGGIAVNEISKIVEDRRKQEFAHFIAKQYPEDKVKYLLGLFSNRSNDMLIKSTVSPDATVPTIYEYVVGLAWYYFSNNRIDLLDSFNLTLSADFEPLVHAGGGMGDIVIYEEDKVLMLEATLMNANSQKRGEWEPVLRHSVNLKIEEEDKNTGREVTTFFIADTFDRNTINIWKAVSSVPLQSSLDKNKYTNNVIIMPINNNELSILMDKKSEYDDIIHKVRGLFIADEVNFDMEWRGRFIEEIL